MTNTATAKVMLGVVIKYRVRSVGCGHGRISSRMFTFQIRTAGEPIKDAGYRPRAVCAV
jgi:hypothetical protein